MTIGGGETADQMVRMMLSGGEVAIRLGGSALKNVLALTMALAKNNQTISGKVNMTKMLKETRDLRLFPMTPKQYKQFEKQAKKQKILFSAIKDRDDNGKLVDVVMPATELDRANLIFERIMYQGSAKQPQTQADKAVSRPKEDRSERSPGRDRQASQKEQDGPQESRVGQEPQRRKLPGDPWEIPPKKDSRSERDSRDTRTKSSTRRDSREDGRTSDRLSILDRLDGFRAQLDSRKQSAPTRNKTKARPRQR